MAGGSGRGALFLVRLLDNEWLAGLVATAVMAVLGFVMVGVSPRRLGRLYAGCPGGAHRLAGALLVPRILGPVPGWLIRVGACVRQGRPQPVTTPLSREEEFREFVDRASESEMIEDNEAELIHSVFDLGETMVRAVMVPRTDIRSHRTGRHPGGSHGRVP